MTVQGDRRIAWRDGDIVMVSVTALAGAIAILLAWFGAGGTTTLVNQASWLQLAVAGFTVSAFGFVLWLLRGRRALSERRIGLIALDTGDEPPEPGASRGLARGATSTAPLRLVRAVGMARVHQADCPLVAGKSVAPATVADGEHCRVCHE